MHALLHAADHQPPGASAWANAILAAFPALAEAIDFASLAMDRRSDTEAAGKWRSVVAQIYRTNLAPRVLESYCALSQAWPQTAGSDDLVMLGRTAIHLGRSCGAGPASRFLDQWRQTWRQMDPDFDGEGYCLGLERLAEAAPDMVATVLDRWPQVVQRASGKTFFAWVHAGLRAHGNDRLKRLAFFDLSDAFSRQLLDQDRGQDDLSRLERRLHGNLLALWGEKRQIGPLDRSPAETQVPLRASLAGGVLRLPASYPGFAGEDATGVYRAAAAHAGAHYRYSTTRFPLGTLKPLQVVLVSLIEDARIEALAIRHYPGLRPLWLRQHGRSGPKTEDMTAAGLMQRLALALLDPGHDDGNGWVAKGRALFAQAHGRLDDPQISRSIGGLLGNDLGQMRVQFNAKTYVVQPAYRDDNLALWDFGDQPDAPQDEIRMEVDSIGARTVEGPEAGADPADGANDQNAPPRMTAVSEERDGAVIATYPEWDYALALERPDWVTVRHKEPLPAGRTALPDHDALTQKIVRIARGVPIGQRVRRKRLGEGGILDLDAAIEANLARRMNRTPDERVFQRSMAGPRDLAALLLIDLSESTADRDAEGRTVLALELEAAAAIGRAMVAAGDTLAIDGFCSDGRENLHYTPFKGFAEPLDSRGAARLAGATSGCSTRLGAALRHAGRRLEQRRAFRRILVLLTDGEPSDVDVDDPDYLKEDARAVIHGLRRRGIDAFAFGVGGHASAALPSIFGHKRTLHVSRAAMLPRRLLQLYEELKK